MRFAVIRHSVPTSLFLLSALLSVGCDPGSSVDFALDGESTCSVSMRSNSTGFAVDMELDCDPGGENCYRITALSCQGADKSSFLPIDLEATGECPGGEYCVASCSAGLDAPGVLWDLPSLRNVDGCDIYEDRS